MPYDVNQIKSKFNSLTGNSNTTKTVAINKANELLNYGKDVVENTKMQINPFLRNGKLVNPYINYQNVLDNPNVTNKAKEFITQATGLTPTQTQSSADNLQSYESYTKSSGVNSGGSVGSISEKYESGGNGGTIAQDTGGVSYGVSQFHSGAGSADAFVSWLKKNNPEMGNTFGIYKAGTNEFSNAWTQVYSKYGENFTDLQRRYTYENFALPLANLAKQKTGVDYTRSPALMELVYSTAVQFGSGNLGLSALGNVTSDMSDADIINASYDKKISNYKSYFNSSSASVQESAKNRFVNERNDVLALLGSNSGSTQGGSGSYTSSVGKKVANTSAYNNNAAKGQCVWYARGRAAEKLGVDPGAIGNANEMWYNAKQSARLSATAENIKPNTLLSYKYGTSSGGQKYGHVIYIEDVVGDTVYYTEGGSGYYKNGTDGVVKTATRQQILNGVNSSGSRIGSEAIGLIDLSKY